MSARAVATMVLSRKVTNSTSESTASDSRGRVVPGTGLTTTASYPPGCRQPRFDPPYTAARCETDATTGCSGWSWPVSATSRCCSPNPGMVAADTKQFLYLDPGRLTTGAASMWDPNTGLGTVTHQNIGYLFPMGPYYTADPVAGRPGLGGAAHLDGVAADGGRPRGVVLRRSAGAGRIGCGRGRAGLHPQPVPHRLPGPDLGHRHALGGLGLDDRVDRRGGSPGWLALPCRLRGRGRPGGRGQRHLDPAGAARAGPVAAVRGLGIARGDRAARPRPRRRGSERSACWSRCGGPPACGRRASTGSTFSASPKPFRPWLAPPRRPRCSVASGIGTSTGGTRCSRGRWRR